MRTFHFIPSPITSAHQQILDKNAGWGRGPIVGGYEILTVTSVALRSALDADSSTYRLPHHSRRIGAVSAPPALQTALASVAPGSVTVADLLVAVFGTEDII